ncbi:MAG: hypothetical protein KA369_08430 [Spirochaetes bacterium]|nr:hypothetical protein [Spirochaetota bacterium]
MIKSTLDIREQFEADTGEKAIYQVGPQLVINPNYLTSCETMILKYEQAFQGVSREKI